MDLQRVFLFLIFSFSVYFLWDGWQREQHPELQTVSASSIPVASQSVTVADKSAISPRILLLLNKLHKLVKKLLLKPIFFVQKLTR